MTANPQIEKKLCHAAAAKSGPIPGLGFKLPAIKVSMREVRLTKGGYEMGGGIYCGVRDRGYRLYRLIPPPEVSLYTGNYMYAVTKTRRQAKAIFTARCKMELLFIPIFFN